MAADLRAVAKTQAARRAEVAAILTANQPAADLIRRISAEIRAGRVREAKVLFVEASWLLDPGTLAEALGHTVKVPAGTIVWGRALNLAANPLRGDWGWRCGCCPWTAWLYKTRRGAEQSAIQHRDEDHPTAQLVRLGA